MRGYTRARNLRKKSPSADNRVFNIILHEDVLCSHPLLSFHPLNDTSSAKDNKNNAARKKCAALYSTCPAAAAAAAFSWDFPSVFGRAFTIIRGRAYRNGVYGARAGKASKQAVHDCYRAHAQSPIVASFLFSQSYVRGSCHCPGSPRSFLRGDGKYFRLYFQFRKTFTLPILVRLFFCRFVFMMSAVGGHIFKRNILLC